MARSTSPAATNRQKTALEIAARRAGFRDPQLAIAAVAGTESRNWHYDLTKVDASLVLDALRDGLAPEAEPGRSGEGAPSAVDALAMLGQIVNLTMSNGVEVIGRVTAIVPSQRDGSPAIVVEGDDLSHRRISVISTWAIQP